MVVEEESRVRVDQITCNRVSALCTICARGVPALGWTNRGAVTLTVAHLARALVHLRLEFGQVRVVLSLVVAVGAGRLCSSISGKNHENQTRQSLHHFLEEIPLLNGQVVW